VQFKINVPGISGVVVDVFFVLDKLTSLLSIAWDIVWAIGSSVFRCISTDADRKNFGQRPFITFLDLVSCVGHRSRHQWSLLV
jgi:hypothetical protein